MSQSVNEKQEIQCKLIVGRYCPECEDPTQGPSTILRFFMAFPGAVYQSAGRAAGISFALSPGHKLHHFAHNMTSVCSYVLPESLLVEKNAPTSASTFYPSVIMPYLHSLHYLLRKKGIRPNLW